MGTRGAICINTSRRNSSLAKRSGAMSNTSTLSRFSARTHSSHSEVLSEVIRTDRTPIRLAARIWLRINARSGETRRVGPNPSSRRSLAVMK